MKSLIVIDTMYYDLLSIEHPKAVIMTLLFELTAASTLYSILRIPVGENHKTRQKSK